MIRPRRSKHFDRQHQDIPAKANRILNIILACLVLVMMRAWHLAVVQYDHRVEQSRKPQRKTVIEPAARATIRDRFNLPLAINKNPTRSGPLLGNPRNPHGTPHHG